MNVGCLCRRLLCWPGFVVLSVPIGMTAQTRDPKPVPEQPRVPVTPTVSMPPRDRPPQSAVGTGTISGRVVDGMTGRPLARARVRIVTGPTTRGPVLTDATGGFAFAGLAAGPYRLSVERNGYLPAGFPGVGSIRNPTDPAVLEKLALSATRILVLDEAPVEANLRRLPLADLLR